MKRGPLLHSRLSGLIAALGHGDLLVVGDAGLPVPRGVECVDLAVTAGVPGIFDVLDAILAESVVERSLIATETPADLVRRFSSRQVGTLDLRPHADLKRRSAEAVAVVRTGEFTPYANICLWSGVAF
ncbi:D-ribose pyranase [Paracoccus beibuensis]|uniref:D-ribose pyranase n=1 Tax=Paracoccus beibuensis TaxID=547602 RepID=UPI0022404185|nr:D-ribose pyranase [Paracoccus beibuensis]